MSQAKQWRRWWPLASPANPRRWHRLIQWPASSLRMYFVIVILVATVPLAVFVSYLIYQETQTGRTQMEDGLKRTADTFALAVEREIVSSVDALSILAYSESLQRNDIAGQGSAGDDPYGCFTRHRPRVNASPHAVRR